MKMAKPGTLSLAIYSSYLKIVYQIKIKKIPSVYYNELTK